jgi:hypothetical protein
MVMAKAYRIWTYTDLERLKLYKCAVELEMAIREQQHRAAHEVLTLPGGCTGTLRNMAKAIYMGQMGRTLPRIVVHWVLGQLQADLRGLKELNIPVVATPPIPEMPLEASIPPQGNAPCVAPSSW